MVTVILQNPKYPHNVAATIRAAACFGADRVRWSGSRLLLALGSLGRLPREERMKGYRDVDFKHSERPFDELAPGTRIVCVELTPSAMALTLLGHASGDVAYVFGPEDGSVSQAWRALCHHFVYIPAHHCLNLSAAVNVVLAHRMMQRQDDELEGVVRPADTEHRGYESVVPGWDGR